jgi:hypothetical protein
MEADKGYLSFEVTIPDAEQNKRLPEKLRKELPDIPTWAVCVLRGRPMPCADRLQ